MTEGIVQSEVHSEVPYSAETFDEKSSTDFFAARLESHRSFFSTNATKDIAWRLSQLAALKQLIQENSSAIQHSLNQDLGKSKVEAKFAEIQFVLSEINYIRKHLKRWSKPKKVSTPYTAFPASSKIIRHPLGVALIIGAWNYPFQLCMVPLAGAIAAGCCAIVKPSELASNTSKLISDLLPQYMDPNAYSVVEGGKEQTAALLNLQFDKIFYTGGERVGKIVMSHAARNLTPITLELGGKSPCVVDKNTNIELTARRIVWGKFMNAGQTCIAPDYVLVDESLKLDFIEAIKDQIENQYSQSPKNNADYGRIINAAHCERLAGFLLNQNIIFGGEVDVEGNYISPTLVLDPPSDSALMQEEIFGPILPVIGLSNHNEMLEYINQRAHPLAAYLFSHDKQFQESFQQQVTSGNLCINDISMFMLNHKLPFGGVGSSGLGGYHGEASFQAFSYSKSVMKRSFKFENNLRYAPFTKMKAWLMSRLI